MNTHNSLAPRRNGSGRTSTIARLAVVAALAIALLASLTLPAHAQAIETTVERQVFVGDNVAPLAPVGDGAMLAEQLGGTTPAGISLLSNGSFTGAVAATGQSELLVQLTDTETRAQELRTVRFTALMKPTQDVSIELDAEVGVELFALVVDAEESFAELAGGELPPGVELVGSQFVRGVPSRGGVFVSRFSATNNLFGNSENITLTITVGDAIVREKLAAARDELQQARTEVGELRDKRNELNAAIKTANEQLAELRTKRAQTTARDERREVNAAIADVRAERSSLVADRTEARVLLADAQAQLAAAREQVAELRGMLA